MVSLEFSVVGQFDLLGGYGYYVFSLVILITY
jgi:hypothetical protein